MKLFTVVLVATVTLWTLVAIAAWDSFTGVIFAFVLGGLFWEGVHRLENRA